jgi:hypothetical protein
VGLGELLVIDDGGADAEASDQAEHGVQNRRLSRHLRPISLQRIQLPDFIGVCSILQHLAVVNHNSGPGR